MAEVTYREALNQALTEEILVCDLDLAEVERSHARRLFLRDRRPELYGEWLRSEGAT